MWKEEEEQEQEEEEQEEQEEEEPSGMKKLTHDHKYAKHSLTNTCNTTTVVKNGQIEEVSSLDLL